ncbi:response regulator [Cohnella sp. CFH 77786]|uniref:helix-turn-helix domain-containing protein n=1 Tax=Cohnella sp. CFH 77786 TaxID=2662265 RepID=UPI001C60BAD0|nr:helix-turn-helix domain-containing protein [Cohnella sp. CFH 77786]MBW5444446.1 response regulator [Cohnella sp. CFH 77786]
MKLMIVDDEVIIRTGLATVIDWHELGITLLSPAASAEEALERLAAEQPDMMLTDIRMTGRSGLQLAEEAMKLLPQLEVIILSGYDDFSYAQQAIRQNVSDYLLKTSRPEEIIKAVLKVKKRIEERHASFTSQERKKREEYLRRFERWIVEGEVGPGGDAGAELPEWFTCLAGDGAKRALVWRVVLVAAEGWGPAAREESLLLFAVDNAMKDTLPGIGFVQDRRIVAALHSEAPITGREHFRPAFHKIERLLKCRLIVVAGTDVDHPRKLNESYEAADIAFTYKPLLKQSHWSFEDIRSRRGGKSVCSAEEEKELSAILLENDPVRLNAWVQQYVRQLLEDAEATPRTFEAALQSVAIAAHRWLERVLVATGQSSALEDQPIAVPHKLVTAPGELLFQHLYSAMELYHGKLAGGQTSHVRKALAYIEEMLGEDIGLQQVAKHVHVHPSHLSDLFKKETGMRFVDYVVKKKMERAAEILLSSPAKISEVAAMVGYEDVKYFGQMFKKYAGKTPSEYREEAGRVRKGR